MAIVVKYTHTICCSFSCSFELGVVLCCLAAFVVVIVVVVLQPKNSNIFILNTYSDRARWIICKVSRLMDIICIM